MPAHHQYTVELLLSQAAAEICRIAATVGINGEALLRNLPLPGTLLKGAAVPVTSSSYSGCCSVLFHINCTAGTYWPYLRFNTFKSGGLSVDFNGWQWLKHSFNGEQQYRSNRVTPRIAGKSYDKETERDRLSSRDRRYQARFQRAVPLSAEHPWVSRRFPGVDMSAVLDRINLKIDRKQIFIPLKDTASCHRGFQVVNTCNDKKRLYSCFEGSTKGAFIPISATSGAEMMPPILCEGLATGLSLSAVWPGAVIIALSALNLAPVRQALSAATAFSQVIICYDNDIWKPHAGNIGQIKALAACMPGDRLLYPCFRADVMPLRPTDFNDLHTLEGINTLSRQVAMLWHGLAF